MKYRAHALAAIAALSLTAGAWAAPAAVIDGVQAPAWLERAGKRVPVEPGTALRNRDRIVTGAAARVVVRLPDGSAVKLGENAQTDLNAVGRRDDGVYTAAIDVLKGAFRLTTDIFHKRRAQRAINVRVGTVTAGIRGTDLWGRSSTENDLICLLEGRIVVSHPQGEATELSEPLQYYIADKGQAPKPVGIADRDELARWAATTEYLPTTAIFKAGGAWAVRVGVASDQNDALALYDRMRAAGYPARILPRQTGGKTAAASDAPAGDDKPAPTPAADVAGKATADFNYEVLVGPLATQEQAQHLGARLAQELGVDNPAAVKRQAAFRIR